MERKLVVGKDCKIKDIIKALRLALPLKLAALDGKWPALAHELMEDPDQFIKELRHKLLAGQMNLEDILTEVIREWTTQKTSNATLDVLVEYLRDETIQSYVEALEEKFYKPSAGAPNNPPSGGAGSAAATPSPNAIPFDKKIRMNLTELLKRTRISPGLTAQLYANGVLGDDDLNSLDAKTNPGDKVTEFYRIMQTRPESVYQHLLVAFRETDQTGVVEVLEKFY